MIPVIVWTWASMRQHFLNFEILSLLISFIVNYTVYLIISWTLLVYLISAWRSRESLIESPIWGADNDCNAVYSLMILFLLPQQIASSTSTKDSKITLLLLLLLLLWETDIIQKANLLQKALTEILYIIFGECRERVRVGGKVIHFNRAVVVLLATFSRTSFEFHIRHYMR